MVMSAVLAPPMLVVAPRRTAPPSVHVIAVLQYLGGLAALAAGALFGYLAVVAGRDVQTEEDFFDPTTIAIAFWILCGVLAGSGLVAILLGRKVQRGRQWARVVVLILSLISVVSIVGCIVLYQAWAWTAIGVVHPALCAWLLNTRAARSWFHVGDW
jgi:hypothetical protein